MSATPQIKQPHLPRANKAVSAEKPEGGSTASNRSVLQQHVDFWDSDKDGEHTHSCFGVRSASVSNARICSRLEDSLKPVFT